MAEYYRYWSHHYPCCSCLFLVSFFFFFPPKLVLGSPIDTSSERLYIRDPPRSSAPGRRPVSDCRGVPMNPDDWAPSSARSKSTRWTKPLRRFEHAPLGACDPGSETRSKFHCVKPPLRRRPKGFDQHSLCLTARSPMVRSLSPTPCEASPKFEASNRCGALKGLVFIRPTPLGATDPGSDPDQSFTA
jgi:hypothetical protein